MADFVQYILKSHMVSCMERMYLYEIYSTNAVYGTHRKRPQAYIIYLKFKNFGAELFSVKCILRVYSTLLLFSTISVLLDCSLG